jgi:CRISPR-associated protein Cmr6
MPIKKVTREQAIKNNMQRVQANQTQIKTSTNTQTIHNPSFYYYKDETYGKDIEKFQLTNTYEEVFKISGAINFELTTTYPGLLIGSGYNHPKSKTDNNDYQLGFFFDHTTGLPVINGSSIKGTIRAIFPKLNPNNKKEKIELLQEYNISYSEELEKELFEQDNIIFYDAYIKETHSFNKGKIFGSDYITSHYSNEEGGEFKDPNPVKFLKVLSEVTFIFQFSVNEKYKDYVDSFKQIILDFGLGAKTNVGYGQFKLPEKKETPQ